MSVLPNNEHFEASTPKSRSQFKRRSSVLIHTLRSFDFIILNNALTGTTTFLNFQTKFLALALCESYALHVFYQYIQYIEPRKKVTLKYGMPATGI